MSASTCTYAKAPVAACEALHDDLSDLLAGRSAVYPLYVEQLLAHGDGMPEGARTAANYACAARLRLLGAHFPGDESLGRLSAKLPQATGVDS